MVWHRLLACAGKDEQPGRLLDKKEDYVYEF